MLVLKRPKSFLFGCCLIYPLSSSEVTVSLLIRMLFLTRRCSVGGRFLVTLHDINNNTNETKMDEMIVCLIFKGKTIM
jgi:hypothetical protein